MVHLSPSVRGPLAGPDAHVVLFGVDYSWASLAERERLSYDASQARGLLERARWIPGLQEAAIVSTCNRTEFYVVGSLAAADAVLDVVRADRPGVGPHSPQCRLRRAIDDDAVRHLFRVATGTASLILGDGFIVRQMKEALQLASAAGTLGAVLSRSFQQAFKIGHRARRTTDIGRGEASLGAVIATVIHERVSGSPATLLVGAGATARDIARQITKRRIGTLTVVNRTGERAAALARMCGAATGEWDRLDEALQRADVVVCATSARLPIVRGEGLAGRQPLLIDAGVPRNIEPPAGMPCVTVDDLVTRQDEALSRRERAVPAVLRLVDQEMADWHQWMAQRPIEGLLQTLFAGGAAARRGLAADLVARGYPGAEDDVERLIGKWTGGWLKGHAAELREWAGGRRGGPTAPIGTHG